MDLAFIINLIPGGPEVVGPIATCIIGINILVTTTLGIGKTIAKNTKRTDDDEMVSKFEKKYSDLKKKPVIGILFEIADRFSYAKDIK